MLSFLILTYLIWAVTSCLLPHEGGTRQLAARPARLARLARRQVSNTTKTPIGTGDRFNGGSIAPRGLGSQAAGTTIKSIMNVAEIKSAVQGLVKEFGIEVFTTPDKTHENATMFAAKVIDDKKLACDDAYRVFLNTGIHARERGGPDNLIYFISDLLWAKKLGTGLSYGSTQKYSNADVLKALSTGIVFMPLSNPDGVAYDQKTGECWRKNRNPAGAVDLNRNFDFLWDFKKTFAPNASTSLASEDPKAETYHGKAPFSEPETRNIKSVMDRFTNTRWFVDLHSFGGDVLYNWGDDTNQDSVSAWNFSNTAYNGKRGEIPDTTGLEYKEFIPSDDWNDKLAVSNRMASGMSNAAGRGYNARQSAYLYATSGASDDYAYSRHFVNSKLNKIHGFTVEFGYENEGDDCPFYPTPDQFKQSILETGAGFMEYLLQAAKVGVGSPRTCTPPPPPPPPAPVCANTCKPNQCGGRATCEVFNPLGGAPNFGKSYCFCQAGYKATGVADADKNKQYHLSWKNANGDQTHRVLVSPGQACEAVCKDNVCSEVSVKDACR
jgi:hypothetical protein